MSVIHFPPPDTPPRGFALLELGFRPFFLAAGVSGTLLMLFWTLYLALGFNPLHHYSPTAWHGHEMLFGFAMAVVVGFLLTAVRNWTQVETIRHGWLALLALLWLAGRTAPVLPLPALATAAIDLAFLPLAAAFIAQPIIKSKQLNHLVFLPLFLLMTLTNLLFHLNQLDFISLPYYIALDMMRWLLVILLTLMGGRVIPFFIERGHPDAKPARSYDWLEKTLIPLTLLAAGMNFSTAPNWLIAGMFLLAGVAHSIRLAGWYQHVVWKAPMLWILVIGYAWLPLGLTLLAFAQFGMLTESAAQHALMAGSLGCLALGMMARVTRGHTGRNIEANRITAVVFILLVLAGLIRVFAVGMQPAGWLASGGLWTLAWLLFSISHLAYWWQPRIDGRPG